MPCKECEFWRPGPPDGDNICHRRFPALKGPTTEEREAMLKALEDSMTSRGWIGHGKELDAIHKLIKGEISPEPLAEEGKEVNS